MRRSILLLATIASLAGHAQVWTGAVNSDWNNAANWSDWPLNGENITIDPVNYAGAAAAPVVATASAFTPDRLFVQGGAVLTLQANLSVDDRLIVGDDAGVLHAGGTLTAERVIMELGGVYTLTGGTVQATGVMALGDDGNGPSRFVQQGGAVIVTGEFGFDVELATAAPRYELNAGTLVVNGDAVWFGAAPGGGHGTLAVNGGSAQVNGSVANSVGSTLDLRIHLSGGSLTVNGAGIDLAHTTDSLVQAGGALHLDGPLVLRNDGVVHATLGSVQVDGAAEWRGTGSYRWHHVLITPGNSLLHTAPDEVLVAGDWTNQGSFEPDGNTITFTGSAPQSITSTAFFGLRVANSSTGLTLVGASSVAGALVLENGLVHTTGADLLTVLHNGTAQGGSAASHVDGPLRKVGNDDFVFPIGKDGQWHRLGIAAINDQDTEFTATYFDAPFSNTTSMGPAMIGVSELEHWTLTRSGSTDEARVTLYWEDAQVSGLAGCDGLVVAHWDGLLWHGQPGTVSGGCMGNEAGSVATTDAVPSYAAFTLGTAAADVGIADADAAARTLWHDDVLGQVLIGPGTAEGQLLVVDARGALVMQAAVPATGSTVRLPSMAPGLYHAWLRTGAGMLHRGMVVGL